MKAEAVIRLKARDKRLPSAIGRVAKKVFLMLVTVYTLVLFTGQAVKFFSLRAEVAQFEEQIRFHSVNNEILRQRVEAMQGDAYIEQMAREQLGLIKPGELLYMAVEGSFDSED
ncbi:MAG: septum formation initiator family protein [Bacillota bacterium]